MIWFGATQRVIQQRRQDRAVSLRFDRVAGGRIEAFFTLYFLPLLVQALIERELRLAMKRERIKELPIYPEHRLCKRPTTEQILRLFSLAERHTLLRDDNPIQSFPPQLTDLQRQTLDLLGVPERAFRA